MRSQSGAKLAFLSILILALGLSATWNLTKYFVFFPASIHSSDSFNESYRNMASYLLSLPDTTRKYVLIDEKGRNNRFDLPVYAHPFYFLTYDRVANMEIIAEDTTIRRGSIFLMLNYNRTLGERILKLYPSSYVQHVDWNGPSRNGGEFDVIVIPTSEELNSR